MARKKKNSVEFIYCGCGCGFTTWKYHFRNGKPRLDRPKKFINGHQAKNKPKSEEHRRKISNSEKGKKISEESRKKHSESIRGSKNCNYGKKISLEQKHILSEAMKGKYLGDSNNMWKGDDAGYNAIHKWIRRHYPPPEKCDMCHEIPPKDLANITGILNRERKNWAYFCRKCHMLFDNIIERNLQRYNELRRNKTK